MATAREIMRKKVVTVKETARIQDVSKLLIDKKLSGVPVVDRNQNLVGFVSEKDIIQAIGAKDFSKKSVKAVMTGKVISVDEATPIDYISEIFTQKPLRCVPVVKGKKVVGIISRKDVIRRFVGDYY